MRRIVALSAAAVLLATVPVGAAEPASTDPAVVSERAPGVARLVAAAPGDALTGDGRRRLADPPDVFRAWLDDGGAARFGAGPGDSFAIDDAPVGARSVRATQLIDGLPVLGGELVASLTPAGEIRSVTGELLTTSAEPARTATTRERATALAVEVVEDLHRVDGGDVTVYAQERMIVAGELLGDPWLPPARVQWVVDAHGTGQDGPFEERVFVDDERGTVTSHHSLAVHAKDRVTCDAQNAFTPTTDVCGVDVVPVRSEGEGPTGVAEVDQLHDFAGAFYDFLAAVLGRDGIDDEGEPIRTIARFCTNLCGSGAAATYYGGVTRQAVFQEGFATEDIVGHELLHGWISDEVGFMHPYQSGAINEGFADLVGELFDQWFDDPRGDDSADVAWFAGEDSPPGFTAVDLAHPERRGKPDRMSSPFYVTGEFDAGGVHTNGYIIGKAGQLLGEGGSHNGRTVEAIGNDKLLLIIDELVRALLVHGSDFADLAVVWPQACRNLVGTHEIVEADCGEVDDAVVAVEFGSDPPGAGSLDAPACPPSMDVGSTDYVNDAEPTAPTVSGERWLLVDNGGREGAGFLAQAPGSVDTRTLTMETDVPVGPDRFATFAHFHRFDIAFLDSGDGGVVEYSTDNGATWDDIGSIIDRGPYSGVIRDDTGNPLADRSAYVNSSKGWTTSRLDLGQLDGQEVRLRFVLGSDDAGFSHGWLVDNIQIHECVAHDRPFFGEDDVVQVASSTSTTATLEWPAAQDDLAVTAYELFLGGDVLVFVDGTVTTHTVTGLTPDQVHELAVVAVDADGNRSRALTARTFLTDTTDPTFAPGDAIAVTNVTGSTADLSWPVASDDIAIDRYEVRVNGGLRATLPAPTTSTTLTGLDDATTSDVTVTAVDTSGNRSDPLVGQIVTPDATPPIFGTLDGVVVSTTALEVAWSPADDNVGVVAYDVTSPVTLTLDGAASGTTITGLQRDTEYDVTVVARDAAGLTSTPVTVLVRTNTIDDPTDPDPDPDDPVDPDPDDPDPVGPDDPDDPDEPDVGNDVTEPDFGEARFDLARRSATSVTVRWEEAVDDVAVAGYQVSIDGRRVDSPRLGADAREWTFTDLRPGTAHQVRIAAFDQAGNASLPRILEATTPNAGVVRLAGPDRYSTAAGVSSDRFGPGTQTVYVATGRNFPDALAAGSAAGQLSAPVLLTDPTSLPEPTRAEIQRLAPERIIVLGGEAAVGQAVAAALSRIAPVERLAGNSRFDTAAAISRSVFDPGVDVVYVATGRNFPDALAGAALAGAEGAPVLLVERDTIPDPIADEVFRLQPGRVVVLGGTGAVSDNVANQLEAIALVGVERISGPDRYATGVAIASRLPGNDELFVATGTNFPDALAASPAAAVAGSGLVLVPRDRIPVAVAGHLGQGFGRIVVLGGDVAVSAQVESELSGFTFR